MNSLPSYYKSLDKTVVEASNDENFLRFDTVFLFRESDRLFYESRNINQVKPYRYYRIRKASNTYISEIYLFNAKGEMIQGIVDAKNHAVTDGNPLTNISLFDNPLIIQFNEPVYIDKIVCLPRNDGNGVYPNNLYELLYHDVNGWQSLGVKEGNNFYLEYENVPKNALYWLRNLTTGIEERIFTYENDRMTFW